MIRRLRGGLAALGLVACVAVGAVSASRAQDGAPQGAARFGVIGAAGHDAALDTLGVGWEQIVFAWDALQPDGPGTLDTSAIDPAALEAAQAAGREVVGLIVRTPAWASAGGEPDAVPDGLALPVRDPRNHWAAFVRALVRHYAPLGVHTWVIYDEPDVRPGEGEVHFAGDVAAYAQMVRVAAQAVRSVDPQAEIHLAALNWWVDMAAGREPYLARLLRIWRADPALDAPEASFDAVRLRVRDSTAAVSDVLGAARAILDAARLPDMPVVLEVSARVTVEDGGAGRVPLFGITPQMQADFVVQAAALARAAGVERFAYGPLADPDDQPGAGLIAPDGTRRPAFAAYQRAIALFAPAERAALYAHDGAALVELNQAARDIYVMWARGDRPVEFVITAGQVNERALREDAAGRRTFVRSQPYDFPAAYFVEVPAVRRDQNGFVTVAGAPVLMIFEPPGDWYRVVYTVIDGQRRRLR